MLVLYKASKARKKHIAEIIKKEGFSKEDVDKQTLSHFNLVKEIANRFIILINYRGNPSPIDWLLRLYIYRIKIRFTTNTDSIIEWVGNILLYKYIKFSMTGLRSIIYRLIKIIQMELQKELLLLNINKDG